MGTDRGDHTRADCCPYLEPGSDLALRFLAGADGQKIIEKLTNYYHLEIGQRRICEISYNKNTLMHQMQIDPFVKSVGDLR